MSTCKNCTNPLPNAAGYCPACGQSTRELSRPWTEVLRESLTESFEASVRASQRTQLLLDAVWQSALENESSLDLR